MARKTTAAKSTEPEPPSSIRKARLPPRLIWEIALKSGRHPKTVQRWYDGKPVRPSVDADICPAAAELGVYRDRDVA